MKLIYKLFVSFLFLSIHSSASNIDSLLIKNDSLISEKSINLSTPPIIGIKKNNILFVNRFDLFLDSINNSIPDTVPFYDWNSIRDTIVNRV